MMQNFCKNTKSSEIFEVNETFLHISEQINSENAPKSIPEAINYLVSKLQLNDLCSQKLKVLPLSPDYLNGAVDFGGAPTIVRIAEALKEATISSIAEEVAARHGVRVVLIAGPSSSGKTTFCKKLTYALEQQGLKPIGISLDDYYVDRGKGPVDEDGKPDWESIYGLNLPMLQEHLATLTSGGTVQMPRYDFAQGKSLMTDNFLHLEDNNILLLEGIHALNPMLTEAVKADKGAFFRIYISGLTTLQLPDGEYFPTTDNRLIRRIVRDAQFRGTSAEETIQRWPSVRRGEEKWIVPYQTHADVNINSAYQYEYALLREGALPLLEQVPEGTEEYAEAQRLITLLKKYHPMSISLLPPYSLLREFLGGSKYEY